MPTGVFWDGHAVRELRVVVREGLVGIASEDYQCGLWMPQAGVARFLTSGRVWATPQGALVALPLRLLAGVAGHDPRAERNIPGVGVPSVRMHAEAGVRFEWTDGDQSLLALTEHVLKAQLTDGIPPDGLTFISIVDQHVDCHAAWAVDGYSAFHLRAPATVRTHLQARAWAKAYGSIVQDHRWSED